MGFGVTNDIYGFAGAKTRCISGSKTPEASAAQAEDSFGDVLEETVYGQDTQYQRTYLVGDDTSFDTSIALGSVHGGQQISAINATRNNKNELQVQVTGEPQGDTAADIATFTIPWPTGYLTGGIGAKMAGMASIDAGRVISSSIAATLSTVKGEDSRGNIVQKYVHGGRVVAQNEVQSVDTEPAVTVDTTNGWAEMPGSGAINEGNTEYVTGSFGAFQNILRN